MSDPIRYSFYAVLTHHIDGPDTAEIRFQKEKDGLFVYWEDYARLKTDVERLHNLVRYWSDKYKNENAAFLRACERIKAKEGKQS